MLAETRNDGNPLFNEDPINDYEEELILLTLITNTLEEQFIRNKDFVVNSSHKKCLQETISSEIKMEEFMEPWSQRTSRHLQNTRNHQVQYLIELLS